MRLFAACAIGRIRRFTATCAPGFFPRIGRGKRNRPGILGSAYRGLPQRKVRDFTETADYAALIRPTRRRSVITAPPRQRSRQEGADRLAWPRSRRDRAESDRRT